MRRITGEKFVKLINKNPSWCKNLKEKIEITTYAGLDSSNITHLSPLITFSGRDQDGWAASFINVKTLKIATGTFLGFVNFAGTGIEEIKNLIVRETQKKGSAANFFNCRNLKVATGNFEGFVNFNNSGVETIKDLNIKNLEGDREKARFNNCPIQYIPKQYRGKAFLFEKEVIKKSIKKDKIEETIKQMKSETNNIEI